MVPLHEPDLGLSDLHSDTLDELTLIFKRYRESDFIVSKILTSNLLKYPKLDICFIVIELNLLSPSTTFFARMNILLKIMS
ncbi:hypothetical protein RCL_jg15793.t1 [Rhizophagus clarus]|uniref:Uncharacterized protein n=1 Tax=Rhizophagus clarus TaxID=94130 RepID=A0A8H3R3N6_9GLOM|nr:hypothetical protein RCL_jg15793.t1 [Rhizophagus clarus]